MEYTSPLGYNFKLNESLASQNDSKSEQEKTSLQNCSSDLELSFNQSCYNRGQKRQDRNSYFQRSSIGSDQKNRWDSHLGTRQKYWKGNTSSSSASHYYHPSMIEDPWKEFEEKAVPS